MPTASWPFLSLFCLFSAAQTCPALATEGADPADPERGPTRGVPSTSAPSRTVPRLKVSACGSEDAAVFGDFKISNANRSTPATQATTGTICWDAEGLHVHEVAQDAHIFSPYTHCNDPVFVASDVLEVFVAPVLATTDNPVWYFELDASPSGALWGGLSNNSKGNSSTCVDAGGCQHSGVLPCTGLHSFDDGRLTVTVTNTSRAWSTKLTIPWTVFAEEFRPTTTAASSGDGSAVHDVKPHTLWRANFYRYSYPDGPNAAFDNFELNAWSPTFKPSFHEPERFGVMVMV